MKKILALFFLVVFAVIILLSVYAGLTSTARPSVAARSGASLADAQIPKIVFPPVDPSTLCQGDTIYTSLPPKRLTGHGLKRIEGSKRILPVQKP